jgi:hypothetical protein
MLILWLAIIGKLSRSLVGELVYDQKGLAQLVERQFDPEAVDLACLVGVGTNAFRAPATPPLRERVDDAILAIVK